MSRRCLLENRAKCRYYQSNTGCCEWSYPHQSNFYGDRDAEHHCCDFSSHRFDSEECNPLHNNRKWIPSLRMFQIHRNLVIQSIMEASTEERIDDLLEVKQHIEREMLRREKVGNEV